MRLIIGGWALALTVCISVATSIAASSARPMKAPPARVMYVHQQPRFVSIREPRVQFPYSPAASRKAPTSAPFKPLKAKRGTPRKNQAHLPGAQSVGCATSGNLPGPVIALASSLKCDPQLIFEYVYNNIEYEPLFGSNKGALGTLLDRRGDDAD